MLLETAMHKNICLLSILLLVNCNGGTTPVESGAGISTISNSSIASPTGRPEDRPPALKDEVTLNWRATNEGISLDWDGNDLYLQIRGGKRQGIFAQIAYNDYKSLRKNPDSRNCSNSHYFRVLSVVGSIVSFEHENGLTCGTSSAQWKYASMDLKKMGDFAYTSFERAESRNAMEIPSTKMVALTELFSGTELLTAFLANQSISHEISTALGENALQSSPRTLSEFSDFFCKFDYSKFGGDFYLEPDFLTRFAFHHIEGEKIAIWISLTPTSHAAQAEQEHLEIFLPIPDQMRQHLSSAELRRKSFLMKDARQAIGSSYAKFDFPNK